MRLTPSQMLNSPWPASRPDCREEETDYDPNIVHASSLVPELGEDGLYRIWIGDTGEPMAEGRVPLMVISEAYANLREAGITVVRDDCLRCGGETDQPAADYCSTCVADMA